MRSRRKQPTFHFSDPAPCNRTFHDFMNEAYVSARPCRTQQFDHCTFGLIHLPGSLGSPRSSSRLYIAYPGCVPAPKSNILELTYQKRTAGQDGTTGLVHCVESTVFSAAFVSISFIGTITKPRLHRKNNTSRISNKDRATTPHTRATFMKRPTHSLDVRFLLQCGK